MAEILDTTRAVIAWSAARAEFLAAGRAALLPFTEDLPDARSGQRQSHRIGLPSVIGRA
jgi:hypothetical protein